MRKRPSQDTATVWAHPRADDILAAFNRHRATVGRPPLTRSRQRSHEIGVSGRSAVDRVHARFSWLMDAPTRRQAAVLAARIVPVMTRPCRCVVTSPGPPVFDSGALTVRPLVDFRQ
jgi:hypothetical protein